MTAKPSQRCNDDSEVLKFKDFQGPLTSNSNTFKALFHFQGLTRSWKKGIIFSRTFKNFQGRVATLQMALKRVAHSRCLPHFQFLIPSIISSPPPCSGTDVWATTKVPAWPVKYPASQS